MLIFSRCCWSSVSANSFPPNSIWFQYLVLFQWDDMTVSAISTEWAAIMHDPHYASRIHGRGSRNISCHIHQYWMNFASTFPWLRLQSVNDTRQCGGYLRVFCTNASLTFPGLNDFSANEYMSRWAPLHFIIKPLSQSACRLSSLQHQSGRTNRLPAIFPSKLVISHSTEWSDEQTLCVSLRQSSWGRRHYMVPVVRIKWLGITLFKEYAVDWTRLNKNRDMLIIHFRN